MKTLAFLIFCGPIFLILLRLGAVFYIRSYFYGRRPQQVKRTQTRTQQTPDVKQTPQTQTPDVKRVPVRIRLAGRLVQFKDLPETVQQQILTELETEEKK